MPRIRAIHTAGAAYRCQDQPELFRQIVALNWHIYILTGSALALGLIGLVRVIPIIVFSLIGGVSAVPAPAASSPVGANG